MPAEHWKAKIKIHIADLIAVSIGRFARTPGRLRILTFHDVSEDAGDIYAVSKTRFAEYLSLLRDEGYTTIRASDLVSEWPSVLSRDRVALLTFDDGYAAQRDVAAELLIQHGMTATFFAITSLLGRDRSRCFFAGKERTFLGGDDLRQMTLGGLEIGSHSHTHSMLGDMHAKQVESEVRLSKKLLEEAIGRDVVAFAYPFGRRCAFSSITRSILKECGYSVAFTQEGVGIRPTIDVLRFPRVNVGRSDTTRTFRRKLQGQYELLSERHGPASL